MRIRGILTGFLSLGLVGAGVVLIAMFALNFFQGPGSSGSDGSGGSGSGFNVPELNEGTSSEVGGPSDKTLKVTVPAMSRIEDDKVPTAAGDSEKALKDNAAIHLKGTGYPWQQEANVYLAGHRLGFPRTESFLTFYDLQKVEDGDKVFVEDAEGTEYTYRVFKEFVVGPSDLSVTEPVSGKNILTLQTCTLPDYSERLIVQAELVETEPANA
ncbi:class E sortase [Rubrobacter aplysinae]|uniref:class E sortase n=1 Tax=Rubrobacter aplysinae TaxID=909625 RepID=UPI001F1E16CE|nr:class E sortase [Rubrobacter aplysinae]